MAPVIRDEIPAQTNTTAGAGGSNGSKPQPVAVEIPITVNGARTVAGSDKREPFSESTQTVLVFASGAVIRLAAAVGPGQLVFVTNEKSKKEVVCQVAKSKQNGNAGGYVELRFTEPAADFWGVRIPAIPGNGSAASAPVVPSAPTKSLEQKLAELNSSAPAATAPQLLTPVLPPATPTPVMPSASISLSEAKAAITPDSAPQPEAVSPPAAIVAPVPVPAPPKVQEAKPAATVTPASSPNVLPFATSSASKIPTLSQFLTQGQNGLELTAEKPRTNGAAKVEQASGATPEKSATHATAPPSGSDTIPGLSAALISKQNPAPGALSFDLGAEEVRIPSWLEPLARNAGSPESKPAESKPQDAKTEEALHPKQDETYVAGVAPEVKDEESRGEAVLTIASDARTPNFGSSLALDGDTGEAKSSGKGLKVALIIVALLLTAAAAWYWYVNQPAKVSASGNRDAADSTESIPAPDASTNTSTDTNVAETTKPVADSPVSTPATKSTLEQPASHSPADASTNFIETSASRSASNSAKQPREEASAVESVPQPVKKPALGDVHLSAPKARRASTQENADAAPGLDLNGIANGNPGGLNMLSSKTKEPSAPVTVGGDVKPAQLLSSVPPVYPQMARTQRVSGDVTIDALIDVSGHVSATRVISGPALLHQAATEAVKQWKYRAAMLNGQPTSMHLTVTVQFRLQ